MIKKNRTNNHSPSGDDFLGIYSHQRKSGVLPTRIFFGIGVSALCFSVFTGSVLTATHDPASEESIYVQSLDVGSDIYEESRFPSGKNIKTSPFSDSIFEIALGDSTLSLANGVKKETALCYQEENTWVDFLGGVTNLSCPGDTTLETVKIFQKLKREYLSSGVLPQRIYITTGTNTLRKGRGVSSLRKDLDLLVEEILSWNPQARIVFIGYLPVEYTQECLSDKNKKTAKYIDTLHYRADQIMREKAESDSLAFVDLRDVVYDICDKNSTFVRLPGTTKGASWHTTETGHKEIAKRIKEELLSE